MLPPWPTVLAVLGAAAGLPALLVLALVGLLGALVLWRVAWQGRQACRAQILLRDECARDRADDLLQDLQGVFFQLEAVQALLPLRAAEASRALEHALQAGDATLERLRQQAAAVTPPATTLDLVAQLGVAARLLARASGQRPQLRVLARGGARGLRSAVHDGLLDAGRAALAEVLRHAPDGRVELELACRPRRLTLRVRGRTRRAVGPPVRAGSAELERVCRASAAVGARVEVRGGRRGVIEVVITLPLPSA